MIKSLFQKNNWIFFKMVSDKNKKILKIILVVIVISFVVFAGIRYRNHLRKAPIVITKINVNFENLAEQLMNPPAINKTNNGSWSKPTRNISNPADLIGENMEDINYSFDGEING